MVSEIIKLSSSGEGIEQALTEAERMAVESELPHDKVLEVRLIAEEMMSMLRSITDELRAEFHIEVVKNRFAYFLSANQRLSRTQRSNLIKSTSSGKNEAVASFLDKLRDAFESALALDQDVDNYYSATGYGKDVDISDEIIGSEQWDKFERSLLLSLADEVKIGIKGGIVDMRIVKQF